MTERFAGAAAALLLAGALAGCGGNAPVPDGGQHAPQEATQRVGDVIVRANAVPAAGLGEAVARQYGIARDEDAVLLLVGVRRDDGGGGETALPARVAASAVDLLGKRQPLAMREVRSGEFIDYVGTARVIAPDTLRFDVDVTTGDGRTMQLRFNRDFFPR